ncbi:MAG: AAA family ATPase [Deltaproteobacteria bacterium]|nr:AAA family ATPase [Deltaproteobacteria bacterium]
MYEEFFQFTARPFSKTPDPGFLYESPGHAEALARLELAVEDRELALLLGDVGSGKTTLTRALIDRLGETVTPVLLTNPKLTPVQLLRIFGERLGLSPLPKNRMELQERLSDRLYQLHEQGKPVVLVIDEAQLIPGKATFDEIRLITNFQLDDTNLLTVILAGQPELAGRLARPAYEALAQRIGLTCRLGPLDRAETARYVAHRLQVAGAAKNPFTEEALNALHRFSAGVPRLLNSIAHGALIDAFSRDDTAVGPQHVESAARERIETRGPRGSSTGEVRH